MEFKDLQIGDQYILDYPCMDREAEDRDIAAVFQKVDQEIAARGEVEYCVPPDRKVIRLNPLPDPII